VLRRTPDKGFDFNATDNATKTRFMAHCNDTFSIEYAFALPDQVVRKMCHKAGGTGIDCRGMQQKLLKAYKEGKVEEWCDDTYEWFANHTLPKCSAQCNSYFCRDRCTLREKWQDLQDEVEAYRIKYDMFDKAKKRFLNDAGLEVMRKAVSEYNKTKCIAVAENLTRLVNETKRINVTWRAAEKELPDLVTKREKSYANVTKAKANVTNSTSLTNATKILQDAEEAIATAKREIGFASKKLNSTKKKLETARSERDVCNWRLGNLTADWKVEQAAVQKEAGYLKQNKSGFNKSVEAVKHYNKTVCAPAIAEVDRLEKKYGNILRQEMQLNDDLTAAKRVHKQAEEDHYQEDLKLVGAKRTVTGHEKDVTEREESFHEARDHALKGYTEVAKFKENNLKPVAAKVKAEEKRLSEAKAADKAAQAAFTKAQLAQKKAKSDLDAATKLAQVNGSAANNVSLEKAQTRFDDKDAAYKKAKTQTGASANAVTKSQTELNNLRSTLGQVNASLQERRAKADVLQDEADVFERKMNKSKADLELAETKVEKIKNSTAELQAAVNKSNAKIENLTAELKDNANAETKKKQAAEAKTKSKKWLEKLVSEQEAKELEVQACKAALTRAEDQANFTKKKVNTQNMTCTTKQGKVDKVAKEELPEIQKNFTDWQKKFKEGTSNKTEAETALRKVGVELHRAAKRAETDLSIVDKDLDRVEKTIKETKARMKEVWGEIKTSEVMQKHYKEVLKEKDAAYKKKASMFKEEIDKYQGKLNNVTAEIERIQGLQKPMEDALGPMLKK